MIIEKGTTINQYKVISVVGRDRIGKMILAQDAMSS